MVPRALLLVAGAAWLAGCGEGIAPPTYTGTLTLTNQSQFELTDARVHEAESYAEMENVLAAPLSQGASVVVDFGYGQRVTVMRPKVGVGELIALTTAEPLPVDRDGYSLIVFDEAFRLMDPPEPSTP